MPGSSQHHNIITPLIVACALFMEQLDGSIITTALPVIAQSLDTDPLHLNLAITSYMFSLAVFIPLSGWVADRFGARNIFRAALIVFTLGSMACGLAQNLTELILSRILQGMGGAMMVPVGRLVLLRTIPKSQLVDAMAWVTAPALIGPVLGPPIGGIIVTYASWRWIFFVNLPIGILGYFLATKYIQNLRGRSREKLDVVGFLFMGLFLAGLVFSFETAGRALLPNALIVGMVLLSFAFFGLYLWHVRRTDHPIVDLSIFKYPTFRASVLGGTLTRISIGGLPFLLPLLFQYGFGVSPASSGFMTFASAAGALLMKIVATPIIRALGFRSILIVDTLINTVFLFSYAFFTRQWSHGLIFILLLAGGFFRSLQFTALNTVAFAEIPDNLISRANTLYNMLQQLSLSLGVTVGAMVLNFTLLKYGDTRLGENDFWPAFLTIAGFCLVSLFFYLPLGPRAGSELTDAPTKTSSAEHKDLA